jgi:flagellar biosynthesis protein FlhG
MREMMSNKPGRARIYAVISGKGGVGKSVICANLAAAFARSGKKTLVLDADLGLASLDIILGLEVKHTLQDLLHCKCSLQQAIVRAPGGFDLLPAGSGVKEGTILTPWIADRLEELLTSINSQYDTILFDAGAGIGDVVLHFARLAHEILLVVTPEPTSMMDAYATIKILAKLCGSRTIHLIVNQAGPKEADITGTAVAERLQQVASKFLGSKIQATMCLDLVGSIPTDATFLRAASRQKLLVETAPEAPSVAAIDKVARTLLASFPSG